MLESGGVPAHEGLLGFVFDGSGPPLPRQGDSIRRRTAIGHKDAGGDRPCAAKTSPAVDDDPPASPKHESGEHHR